MSTTASVSSLTVSELPSTVTVPDYSFIEALSDAGIPVYLDNNPVSRGRPKHQENIVYLWESGCQLHGGWDCPTICKNNTAYPKAVWNDTRGMYTLQNCLVYPVLEYSASQGWLSEERTGLLEKYGIGLNTSTSKQETKPQMGDWPAVGSCRQAMCNQLELKKCEPNPGNRGYDTRHKIGLLDKFWKPKLFVDVHFCRLGWNTPNADIGGAGVLASYIQQLAIAILGWAFLRAPELKLAVCGRLVPRTKARLEEKLDTFRTRSSTAATVSALVGFQETQIFFSITLQVACLITFRKAKLLMAPSIPELVADRFLIKLIGAIGVFPAVLNLCTIRRHQAVVDWFILIASSCCVLIAIATWSFANTLTIEAHQLTGDGVGPPECGDVNPLLQCFNDLFTEKIIPNWLGPSLTTFNSVFLSEPALIVPLLVLIGLAATKFRAFRTRPYVRGDIFEWVISKLPQDSQRHLFKRVIHALVAILECWLVITSLALLIATGMLMAPVSQRGNAWTLGQIIAVAVWAPVLVNLL